MSHKKFIDDAISHLGPIKRANNDNILEFGDLLKI